MEISLDDHRPPIPWAAAARNVAASFQNTSHGHHSVYVVLLLNVSVGEGYSLYVGVTGNTPAERFAAHKAGYKAGKGYVRDYGVGLLTELYGHLTGLEYEDAVEIEAALASALRAVGVPTYGGH